jgi:hypothetical protein
MERLMFIQSLLLKVSEYCYRLIVGAMIMNYLNSTGYIANTFRERRYSNVSFMVQNRLHRATNEDEKLQLQSSNNSHEIATFRVA